MARRTSIQFELENFDRLPDSALVRAPVVAAMFGICVGSVWRRTKLNQMPQPVRIMNASGWRVGDIRAMLKAAA